MRVLMHEDAKYWEMELLLARMKAVQHESQLIREVVRLQRMRIAQLERQLEGEKKYRLAHITGTAVAGCRNCGMPTKYGAVFCDRNCWREHQHHRKMSDAVNQERGTRRSDRVQRKEDVGE